MTPFLLTTYPGSSMINERALDLQAMPRRLITLHDEALDRHSPDTECTPRTRKTVIGRETNDCTLAVAGRLQ